MNRLSLNQKRNTLFWAFVASLIVLLSSSAWGQVPGTDSTSATEASAETQTSAARERLRREADNLRSQAAQLRTQANEMRANMQGQDLEPGQRDALRQSARDLEDAANDLEEAADELETESRSFRIRVNGDRVTLGSGSEDQVAGSDLRAKPRAVTIGLANLDLGVNLLLDNNSFNMSRAYSDLEQNVARSLFVGLDFIPTAVRLGSRHFHLLSSLSLDMHNYEFQRDVVLREDAPYFDWRISETALRRSKLSLAYAKIPLMLRFSTDRRHPEKGFRITLGGYASLMLNSHGKTKTVDGAKEKQRDTFHLNRVQYGLTGRIGFKFVELYCHYALSPLFREAQQPDNLTVFYQNPDFNSIVFGFRIIGI
jgi:hypothetical protein